jgi:geranylgeranyl diphosphate synthase type I
VQLVTDQMKLAELIEVALRSALAVPHTSLQHFYGMMQYHLGWLDRSLYESPASSRGKRVRPLLTLLACQAAGGDVHEVLPAAVAVELVHNFSLVHDDIQDRSDFRRHRETVWKVWGEAQAINVGDALFAMARMHMGNLLDKGVRPMRVISAIRSVDEACLALTEGQFLDMSFERSRSVSLDDYLWMIRGKTAALLACACQVGALVATDNSEIIRAMHQFGYNLGMAFQIEDDILGIWGDPQITGKPAGDDISNRKKTLPVIYVWERGLVPDAEESLRGAADFLQGIYESERVSAEELRHATDVLQSVGAKDYCADTSKEYTLQALAALSHPGLADSPTRELRTMAQSLLGRGC